MSATVKNTCIMTAIACVFGLLLGVVHAVTLEPIKVQQKLTLDRAYRSVMSSAEEFVDTGVTTEEAAISIASGDYNAQIDNVQEAKDASGSTVGYVINVTSHGGYGGDISFSMGVDLTGSIQGISITKIAETPGLGMKAQTDPAWLPQFYGKSGDTEFILGEDGINSITSATFTSRCVTRGINAGLAYFRDKLAS